MKFARFDREKGTMDEDGLWYEEHELSDDEGADAEDDEDEEAEEESEDGEEDEQKDSDEEDQVGYIFSACLGAGRIRMIRVYSGLSDQGTVALGRYMFNGH